MNFKELGGKIGLDEDEYIEMLIIFIESGEADLKKLEDAIKQKDAGRAHQASHSFKGSSGNLGLEDLFEMAKGIDDKAREGTLEGLDEMVNKLRLKYDLFVSEFKNQTAG
jgi:HPt (histidine-containing phosphotransfer) domain-containing protein